MSRGLHFSEAEARTLGATVEPVRPPKKGQGLLYAPEYDSQLEADYVGWLDILKRARDIWDFWYKPFSLRLAPNTYYRPDFLVQLPNGFLEIHETKGYIREDSWIKIKLSAKLYPCFLFVIVTKGENKQWKYTKVDI